MNLTDGEKKLLELFFEDYSDTLGNRGCNDLTDEMRACLSREEWNELFQKYHILNGDPEEYRPNSYLPDFCVLYYLKKKIGL